MALVAMEDFKSASGSLHYRIVGGKAGHPVVFLHGLGASSDQFSTLAPADLEQGPRLYIDLPGHGSNVVTADTKIGFEPFSDLVIALCDKLELRGALFAGISMGSALSLCVAAQRPDLCKGLVAIRPAWLTRAAPKNLAVVGSIGHWLGNNNPAHVKELLEASQFYMQLRAKVPSAAASLDGLITRPYATEHAIVLSLMVQDRPFRTISELKNILCPVTVIGNPVDALHPVSLAQRTARAIPAGRFVQLSSRYLKPDAHNAELSEMIAQTYRML